MSDNGRVKTAVFYRELKEMRKDIFDNHLQVMTEITRLKARAAVWGMVGGTFMSILTAIGMALVFG